MNKTKQWLILHLYPLEFGKENYINGKPKDMQDLNASKKGDFGTDYYTCHLVAHYNIHPFSADSD